MSTSWTKHGLTLAWGVAIATLSWPSFSSPVRSTRTILCENPIGTSTYLPGGFVPTDRAGTQDDEYSGVLRLKFRIGPTTELLEAVWIRDEERVSTSDVKEGGRIAAGFANQEVKRFDVTWGRGSSVIFLVKQLETDTPYVAYADIKAGFGLDKVSSYLVQCSVVSPREDVERVTSEALARVNEWRQAVADVAAATGNAVDAAASVTGNAVDAAAAGDAPPKN